MSHALADFQATVTDLFCTVWMQNDMDHIDRLFHPGATISGLVPGVALNLTEYREAVEQYQQLARLQSFDVLEILHDGADRAAVRLRLNITSLVIGQTAPQDAMMFLQLRDTRIFEAHVQFDTLQFFELLGALPSNSAFLLLSGHSMT